MTFQGFQVLIYLITEQFGSISPFMSFASEWRQCFWIIFTNSDFWKRSCFLWWNHGCFFFIHCFLRAWRSCPLPQRFLQMLWTFLKLCTRDDEILKIFAITFLCRLVYLCPSFTSEKHCLSKMLFVLCIVTDLLPVNPISYQPLVLVTLTFPVF